MSSTSAVRVSVSTSEVLFTTTVNVTSPPGSSTEVGLAALLSVADDGTSVIVTVASSLSLTGFPSSSMPEAVATFVSVSPALPLTNAANEQE